MIKKKFRIDTVFELCHKKAWSLWFVYGYKRYFITCKIRDICNILSLDLYDLNSLLADTIENSVSAEVEEVKF